MKAITKQRRYRNPNEIIKAAKAIIDKGYWGRGAWGISTLPNNLDERDMLKVDPAERPICRVCVEGALALCAVDWEAYAEAVDQVSQNLPEDFAHDELFAFNDAQEDQDAVSELLAKSIEEKK